jgi:K+-sensing histidine kinase KdpD
VTAIGVALPAEADVAQTLIERTSALAERLSARWVAFVICNDALPSPAAESALRQAQLAMVAGGTVFFCEGEDKAETLLALANREQVDILIVGAPADRWRLRRGTVERMVRARRSFDVVVVGQP